jgi:hypothetical protein
VLVTVRVLGRSRHSSASNRGRKVARCRGARRARPLAGAWELNAVSQPGKESHDGSPRGDGPAAEPGAACRPRPPHESVRNPAVKPDMDFLNSGARLLRQPAGCESSPDPGAGGWLLGGRRFLRRRRSPGPGQAVPDVGPQLSPHPAGPCLVGRCQGSSGPRRSPSGGGVSRGTRRWPRPVGP